MCELSHLSCLGLFATLWTVPTRLSLSMGFSRQEYWSVLPFLPAGDLPNPGIKPKSLMSPALAGGFFTTSTKKMPYLWVTTGYWQLDRPQPKSSYPEDGAQSQTVVGVGPVALAVVTFMPVGVALKNR